MNAWKVTQRQRQRLAEAFSDDIVNDIIAGAEGGGKALEALGVQYKSLVGNDDKDGDPQAGDLLVLLEALGATVEKVKGIEQRLDTMREPMELIKGLDDTLQTIQATAERTADEIHALKTGAPRASKSRHTQISDSDAHANYIHRQNYENGNGAKGGGGLVGSILTTGKAELSDAFPTSDDMPPPPQDTNSTTD